MRYVIGDIHGEFDKLRSLLKYIPVQAELIFIGDYIDKGPNAKAVVDLILNLKKKRKVTCLLGNHEFKLLQAWQGIGQAKEFWLSYGGRATLESYWGKSISEQGVRDMVMSGRFKEIMKSHLSFYKSLKPYAQEGSFCFVHGGIPVDRLGRYRLGNTENMVFARKKFLPLKKKFRGRIIVFGHTAFSDVFWDGVKLGIDTGAVYKDKGFGILTAVNLDQFECITHQGRRYVPRLVKG